MEVTHKQWLENIRKMANGIPIPLEDREPCSLIEALRAIYPRVSCRDERPDYSSPENCTMTVEAPDEYRSRMEEAMRLWVPYAKFVFIATDAHDSGQ